VRERQEAQIGKGRRWRGICININIIQNNIAGFLLNIHWPKSRRKLYGLGRTVTAIEISSYLRGMFTRTFPLLDQRLDLRVTCAYSSALGWRLNFSQRIAGTWHQRGIGRKGDGDNKTISYPWPHLRFLHLRLLESPPQHPAVRYRRNSVLSQTDTTLTSTCRRSVH
jgi:hypothetical protein